MAATVLAGPPDRSGPPPVPTAIPVAHDAPTVLHDGPARQILAVPIEDEDDVVVRVIWTGSFAWRSGPMMALERVWAWGTDEHPGYALDDALRVLDASLEVLVFPDRVVVEAAAGAPKLVPLVALLDEVVGGPELHRVDVRTARREIDRARPGPGAADLADAAIDDLWYGVAEGGPRHKEVVAAWRALRDRPATILVVGGIDPERARVATEILADHTLGRPAEIRPSPPAPHPGDTWWAVPVPGSDRVEIRVRTEAPPAGHPDAAAFEVLTFALVDSYTSRLYRDLVTRQGLAYDVLSDLVVSPVDPSWTVTLSVPADRAAEAVGAVEHHLAAFPIDGPSPLDLRGAHARAVREWNETLAHPDDAADAFEQLVVVGESVAQARQQLDALGAVTADQVRATAQRWLTAPRWVLAGDPAAVDAAVGDHAVRWRDR